MLPSYLKKKKENGFTSSEKLYFNKVLNIYIIVPHLCSCVLKPLFFVPAELHTGEKVTYYG